MKKNRYNIYVDTIILKMPLFNDFISVANQLFYHCEILFHAL